MQLVSGQERCCSIRAWGTACISSQPRFGSGLQRLAFLTQVAVQRFSGERRTFSRHSWRRKSRSALASNVRCSLKVLVIGSGGREHALCDKIAESPHLKSLYAAPGNPGMERVAHCVSDLDAADISAICGFVQEKSIDLVVIGPEAPLVSGLVDALGALKVRAFGPSQAAARLEGSKAFSKAFMKRHGIPTADYDRCGSLEEATAALGRRERFPVVIKADGLAAGKGVFIASNRGEAEDALCVLFVEQRLGEAGRTVVIEDYLIGEEASFFALVNGEQVVPLLPAQDHKAAYDGDRGPNTGGMGAYAPAPVVTPQLAERILAQVVRPTAAGMVAEGTPYRGLLYCGLMIESGDAFRVLEYNVRFGDPECQVLCMLLESDLLPVLFETASFTSSELPAQSLQWAADAAALTVVLASPGYPGPYRSGDVIRGLEEAETLPGVKIFHAGTSRDARGQLVAKGGRVLNVTAHAATLREAQQRAYEAIARIDWPDAFYRRDIGWRALEREQRQKPPPNVSSAR
jgi:phosphoribosylamine--glycine ligase